MTCKTGHTSSSVRQCSVNMFKTLTLWDRWADVDETWHVYFMGLAAQLLSSRILYFSPFTVWHQHKLSPVVQATKLQRIHKQATYSYTDKETAKCWFGCKLLARRIMHSGPAPPSATPNVAQSGQITLVHAPHSANPNVARSAEITHTEQDAYLLFLVLVFPSKRPWFKIRYTGIFKTSVEFK